ncbi:uncharacterized protein [Syngnathus scovelli]|uniref:uncharacterized protein isoform X2 n=1 Tax=Syngnathus scovelli TaxID=161590 RepID=UPI0021105B6A|nr:uncharacterized protein LOC125986548 isoform X2 [Syngnathus scovelli]
MPSRWSAVHLLSVKMWTPLQLLILLIPYGGCLGDPDFTTKTLAVGQNFSLDCTYKAETINAVYWIRLVSGTFPEILFGSSFTSENGLVKHGDRLTAKKESGNLVLQISKVQKSDIAIYYCLRVGYQVQFLSGTFLHVRDNETDIQNSRSDESRPGPFESSQCSVLQPVRGNESCTDGHKVYWFSPGTNGVLASFVYAHEQCEKVRNDSIQKCVYAVSKNVSSSDARTDFCAVATCGEIFIGKATNKAQNASGCDTYLYVVYVLGAALVLCVIFLAILIEKRMTQKCFGCRACSQTHEETSSHVKQVSRKKEFSRFSSSFHGTCVLFSQRDEDSLVYSVPKIITRKSGKASQTNARTPEEFCVYSRVHE